MDAFSLALSYGILKISRKKVLFTAFIVGIFHYIMPFLGNKFGDYLFDYVFIKPKIIVFMVFLLLSINMFISFLEKERKLRHLNLFGIILFAFFVSLDSFSVGLTLCYITNNLVLSYLCFSAISLIMTVIGFIIGRYVNKMVGKYSYLIGFFLLLLYAFWVLTK